MLLTFGRARFSGDLRGSRGASAGENDDEGSASSSEGWDHGALLRCKRRSRSSQPPQSPTGIDPSAGSDARYSKVTLRADPRRLSSRVSRLTSTAPPLARTLLGAANTMNTVRALLPACALFISACSSASSGGDVAPIPKSDSGADVGSGSGSSGGSSGGTQPPPKPANCSRGIDCYSCCAANLPGGAQLYRIAELDCVCVGAGSCAQECTGEECAALLSDRTNCEACIQTRMNGACAQQATTACSADSTCKLYMQCMAGCQ